MAKTYPLGDDNQNGTPQSGMSVLRQVNRGHHQYVQELASTFSGKLTGYTCLAEGITYAPCEDRRIFLGGNRLR